MQVIENRTRESASLPGLTHWTLAGGAEGLSRLSVWRQSIAAGAVTPPHRHDCEEVVVVLSGSGQLLHGDAVVPFGPDTTLVVPANAVHQIINTGDVSLELVAALSASPVEVFLPDGAPLPLPWPT